MAPGEAAEEETKGADPSDRDRQWLAGEEDEEDEMEEEPEANTKARKSLKVKRTPRKNT
jgi:hypothetical protein